MKRVQLSGTQKRKLAKQKEQNVALVAAKTGKLANYFVPVQQRELSNTDRNHALSETEDIST
ncbi:hypothetical protein ACJMK2_016011, partial [Sinanodonta woodiana]